MPDAPDVVRLRAAIAEALRARDERGRIVGASRFGVYAFYDYDGEPIYVGQTRESLATRIRRHLTNQRTDAVAMNVLDPFEVAEIEMWPLWGLASADKPAISRSLNDVEFTVFQRLLAESAFNAILNEVVPGGRQLDDLPPSLRVAIVPPELREERGHPDVRLARRASTIAALARVISERKVSPGLRRTFLTQARRLEWLAAKRLEELGISPESTAGEADD